MIPAGFRHIVLVHHLAARGWTLDLRGACRASPASSEASAKEDSPAAAASARRSFSFLSTASAADVALAPADEFLGVLNQIRLPVDFALDGLDLEGDVILPIAPGRAAGRVHVMLDGVAASPRGVQRGTFRVQPHVSFLAAADAPVNFVVADGTLFAAMDGPRTFRRLALRADATATGRSLLRPVRLSVNAGATRASAGETYSLTLAGENKQLASLQAGFPDDRRHVAGTWKLDVSDDDLTPFMLGRGYAPRASTGSASWPVFDADATLTEYPRPRAASISRPTGWALVRPAVFRHVGAGAARC